MPFRLTEPQAQILVFSKIIVCKKLKVLRWRQSKFVFNKTCSCLYVLFVVVKTGNKRSSEEHLLFSFNKLSGILENEPVGYSGSLFMLFVIHALEVVVDVVCVLGNLLHPSPGVGTGYLYAGIDPFFLGFLQKSCGK